MPLDPKIVHRLHQVLVDEIRTHAPEYLESEFTVAEIYQKLIPYGTHRDRIGVEMNGDYEDALLRLLSGEEDLLRLESEPVRARIQRELKSSNPNTGIFREFAAVGVRLNPDRLPEPGEVPRSDPEWEELDLELDKETDDSPSTEASPEIGEGSDVGPGGGTGTVLRRKPPQAMEDASQAPGLPTGEGVPEACPGCAAALPRRAGLQFCPFCGVNVQKRSCPECDEVLEWKWAFCIACGTEVNRP